MRIKSLRMVLVTLAALLFLGCQRESHVKISLLGSQRSGQEVTNRTLELVEGQVLHLRVLAVKKRTIKENWKVNALALNPSIASVLSVKGEDHENEFIVSGVSPGRAEIEFSFRGREVHVGVEVTERGPWKPTVDPYSFGGAGGGGGGSLN